MTKLRLAVIIPAMAGTLLAGITPALAEDTSAAMPLNSTNIPARYANQG
jgi:hypothetical protein